MKKVILAVVLYISGSVFAVLSGSGTQVDPYLIQSRADFDEFANPANAGLYWASGRHTKLMCDPNLAGTTYTQAVIAPDTSTSYDFQGIPFTGIFDGNGHTISNLTINQPTKDYIGLFGYVDTNGQIRNLGMVNVNIAGHSSAGGLVGFNYYSTLTSCYTTGVVSGYEYVGGLMGWNYYGSITSCYATGAVSGTERVGGLSGWNYYGSITSCYATGTVSGRYVGGLVGWNETGTVTSCYATGAVGGDGSVGGLMGWNYYGSITSCYATGAVNGGGSVGGLVGWNYYGTITSSFWDIQASGKTTSAGGTGLTTDAMHNTDPYLRFFWDFKGEIANGTMDIWTIPMGGGYPIFTWQTEDSTVNNDEMGEAIAVTADSTISGSSLEATGLDITGNGYNDWADVWYYFDCTDEGKYTITVEPSGFNSTLGVFDAMQREIIFNDDFFGEKSVVILNASAGRRYYIRVAGYDGQTGDFTLTVAQGAIQAVQGDVNYDGFVNLSDFAIFADNWLVGF